MSVKLFQWLFLGLTLVLSVSCQNEAFEPRSDSSVLPEDIEPLISTACAVTGCHDAISNEAAAGLDLTDWNTLMAGSRNNAVVVPYSPAQSALLFILNRDEDVAPVLQPTMPIGGPYLSEEEVALLIDWISAGAPNARGDIAFEQIPQDQKLYILNNLCREVAVIDLVSGSIMRYHRLPEAQEFGFAADIVVDPATGMWCVLFANGWVQCFDVRTSLPAVNLRLPEGTWRSLERMDDGTLMAVNWSGNTDFQGGQCALIDLRARNYQSFEFPDDQVFFPVGWTGSATAGYFMSAYLGNAVYQVSLSKDGEVIRMLSLDGEPFDPQAGRLRPFSTILSPDEQFLYVACERTGEVRKVDLATGQLDRVITVGYFPQEMVIDRERHILFVTCTEDEETFPGRKGSLYAIDLRTDEVMQTWQPGYQPRALWMDGKRQFLYIANRNVDPQGADEPHHYTECEGKNGYVTRIDLASMQLDDDYRAEVSVDPLAMSAW